VEVLGTLVDMLGVSRRHGQQGRGCFVRATLAARYRHELLGRAPWKLDNRSRRPQIMSKQVICA
jgi:hypothetical protein